MGSDHSAWPSASGRLLPPALPAIPRISSSGGGGGGNIHSGWRWRPRAITPRRSTPRRGPRSTHHLVPYLAPHPLLCFEVGEEGPCNSTDGDRRTAPEPHIDLVGMTRPSARAGSGELDRHRWVSCDDATALHSYRRENERTKPCNRRPVRAHFTPACRARTVFKIILISFGSHRPLLSLASGCTASVRPSKCAALPPTRSRPITPLNRAWFCQPTHLWRFRAPWIRSPTRCRRPATHSRQGEIDVFPARYPPLGKYPPPIRIAFRGATIDLLPSRFREPRQRRAGPEL